MIFNSVRMNQEPNSLFLYSTIMVVVFLVQDSHQQDQDCETGWFGPGCRFKCHCKTACNGTGSCVDELCEIGYFGYRCQYRDLATMATQEVDEVTDGDDNTCMRFDANTKVTIAFTGGTFRFFRIIVIKDSGAGAVELISYQIKINDAIVDCDMGSYYVIRDPRIKDVYCKISGNATGIVLSGVSMPLLCTVNICAGRNLALKQSVSSSSFASGVMSEMGGVDGEIPKAFDPNTCFLAGAPDSESKTHFRIVFNVPVLIDCFVLYNSPDSVDYKKMVNFTLYTYDDKMTSLMTYQEGNNPPEGLAVYYIYNSRRELPLKQAKLEKVSDNNNAVQFCEIEAYGDCAVGTYGLDCTNMCDTCAKKLCDTFTGECHLCKEGSWGDNCEKVCPDQCANSVCDKYTSECSLGCNAGYQGTLCKLECQVGNFGPDCSHNCSVACPKNCTKDDGRCLSMECPKGAYGHNCEYTCSQTCAGSGTCDIIDGRCIEGCKTGFYGVDCFLACSPNCKDNAHCNQDTGACPRGCMPGYFGDNCKVGSIVCPENCDDNKSCDLEKQICTQGCDPGYGGETCNSSCFHCVGGLCNQYSLNCTSGCKEGVVTHGCSVAASKGSEDDEESSYSTLFIVIAIFGLIPMAAIIAHQMKKKKPPLSVTE
uniref:EGF-like domain-containing protein n=2 Tax=Biomphalaria glabrata TaxID=6526 RepID=A0A2C9LFA2_BIOGL